MTLHLQIYNQIFNSVKKK